VYAHIERERERERERESAKRVYTCAALSVQPLAAIHFEEALNLKRQPHAAAVHKHTHTHTHTLSGEFEE
jgi:hypothetical protein